MDGVSEHVQGRAGVHQVDVEVYELGSFGCEDRGPEDASVGGVGDDLDEALVGL